MTREDKTMIKTVRVLRDKFRRKDVPAVDGVVVPWWVNVLTDWGRPIVAAVVLTMCAPGEHYLAHYAGWSFRLAWGMPFVLTAYAGISAVVATKRPSGSPGKRTAVLGAILSILLAMAAQPIAHLYQLHLISGHRFALVIVTSCIPALVLGHLLHLAVSHVLRRRDVPAVPVVPEDKDTAGDKPVLSLPGDITPGVPLSSGTKWLFEDKTYRAGVPEDEAVLVSSGDKDAITAPAGAPEDVPAGDKDNGTRPAWLYDEDGIRPGHREDTGDAMHYSPPRAEDELSSHRKLPDLIKDIRARVGDDPDAIKDGVLATPGWEGMRSTPQRRNTLNTAVRRALRKSA